MKRIISNLNGALILFAALNILLSTACAQGTAFTYQGRLMESNAPASGIFEFEFTLFNAATNGSNLGVLTIEEVPVTNGLFVVTLDFGSGVFTGAARWLEIRVRNDSAGGSFVLVQPRQQITSTPYSIQAANAGSATTATSVSGSVSAAQLTGTISSNNIGTGSITSVMLASGAVGSNQIAVGAVNLAALHTVPNWFSSVTFSNPTAIAGDAFGYSMAAVGTDKVLVGAYLADWFVTDSGAAYLFNTNGALLTNFLNLPISGDENAGYAVAALGAGKILVGAPLMTYVVLHSGAAYIYGISGQLLTTITNPTPQVDDRFGAAIAAFGNDRLLIGAPSDNTGAPQAGAAYLYRTNGTLLTTFTNPTPANIEFFGSSVLAIGSDKVLIAAINDNFGATQAGAAYLFNTNGQLLLTFTNPTPEFGDNFGSALATVGTDKILFGALSDNTGAPSAGAAYLFHTNGTLLTTITNPTPAGGDAFGWAVAAVGADKLIVSAFNDTTDADFTGAAYLFATNGQLLATLTSPTAASGGGFGSSIAVLSENQIAVGATYAAQGGAVYRFDLGAFLPGLLSQGVVGSTITAANIYSVDAATISSGILSDARLSANVSLLGQSISSSEIVNGTIVNADVSTSAAIDDTKLATINAPGKVADTALSANVALRSGANVFNGNQVITNGSLGIGIVNPSRELEVQHAGDTEIGIKSTDAGGHLWTLQSSAISGSANLDGSFQIIDRTLGGSRLLIGTNGNVGIGTSNPTNKLHVNGGISATAFITTSDRNAKENFEPVSSEDVLDKVLALPITTWNFKELQNGRHIGPMAQDFYAAFNLGNSDTTITSVDLDGVALAAIQGLNQKLEEQRAQSKAKDAEIESLKQSVAELRQLVGSLAEKNDD